MIIQHVVISESVPRKRRRPRLPLDADHNGRPAYAFVYSLDELRLEHSPTADVVSPLGRLLATLLQDTQLPAILRHAVTVTVRDPDAERRKEQVKVIRCIVDIWLGLTEQFLEALAESLRTMPETGRREFWRENFDTLATLPGPWSKFKKKRSPPDRKQQRQKDSARRQAEKGRNSLLGVLRERGILLPASLLTKLKQLPPDQLPSMNLAREAESVTDFAERAGLSGEGEMF